MYLGGSTDLSCQKTHSCRSGYGRSFFSMVMRSSARFSPLTLVVVGVLPFTWSAGASDDGGGLGWDAAVVVAMVV